MIDYTLNAGCSDATPTSYAACERWAHQDRLGSVVAASDSTGAMVEEYKYSPYGVSGAEGNSGFPFRFTGQRLDAATGLYFYKARFYAGLSQLMIALIFFQLTAVTIILGAELNRGIMALKGLRNGNGLTVDDPVAGGSAA